MSDIRVLSLLGGVSLFGQERANMQVLSALRDKGCQVLCVIRNDDWNVHIPKALDLRGIPWNKIPYIAHRTPGRPLQFLVRNLVNFIVGNVALARQIRTFQPTHILAPSEIHAFSFLACLMFNRSIPLIYRAGDVPTIHNLAWRMVWASVRRRVDRFVANSQYVAQALKASGVPEGMISVIYNSPPERPHHTWRPEVPPVVERILYVGQIAPHKGVHVLVEAFRDVAPKHPSARLVIAGRISDWSGDAWGRELMKRVQSDALVNDRVIFAGEEENIPGLLAESGFVVVPSLFQDPAPNVIVEAKAAGRGAIAFPRGGIPELVEHEVNGLICREASVAALTEALDRYLSNRDMVLHHGIAAAESLGRFCNSGFGEKWLDVCRKCSG